VPADVDPHVAAIAPAQLLQGLLERREAGLAEWIVCGPVHEHADTPHPLGLLCVCSKRPRCRSGEQRDELAPFHSIESHQLPQQGSETSYRIGEDGVSGLLRCGISTLLMIATGHFRQINPLPTLSGCPLRSDRVRTFAPQRFDAVCHFQT
jgi:hypothetical protein